MIMIYKLSHKLNDCTTDSLDDETLQMYCCGDRVRNYLHYPIRLYTWEHLCVAVDLGKKQITVVLNDYVSV